MNRGDVEHQKIDRKENLANPFTKALAIKEFDNHKSKMGIRYCAEWLLDKWELLGNVSQKANRQAIDG